jgi:hypothetical protein
MAFLEGVEMKRLLLGIGIAFAALGAAGAAQAQVEISRTTDGTLTWTGTTFTGASMHYAPSEVYDSTPFSDVSTTISLFSNYKNFMLTSSGGITASAGTIVADTVPVMFSNSGGPPPNVLGWNYDTPADASGTLPLTLGTSGGLATLNFNDGGFDSGVGINYFVYIHLPGDWSTSGTATGDHEFNSVAAGFSIPTFIYDPVSKMTTVFTDNLDYTGGLVALNFTLFGGPAAVPEPSTWAMMIAGFAGLGFLGWRRTPRVRAAA